MAAKVKDLFAGHINQSNQSVKLLSYAAIPTLAIISLKQHKGLAALPVVAVGQMVERGQLIARASDNFSADIHSPAPGIITSIEPKEESHYGLVTHIKIKIGGHYSSTGHYKNLAISKLTPDAILHAIKTAGIVEVGKRGALPMAHYLNNARGSIGTLVINAIVDEPYTNLITTLLTYQTEEISQGIAIVSHLLKPKKIILAINQSLKSYSIALQEHLKQQLLNITLHESNSNAADSNEYQLAELISGQPVNLDDDIAAVHITIIGLNSLISIYRALFYGENHIQHAVSISGGAMKQSRVLMTYIGTPLLFLLDECGGYDKKNSYIVAGSALTGFNVIDDDVAITKEIEQVVVLSKIEAKKGASTDCTMCNDCIKVCPRALWPHSIYKSLMANRNDLAKEFSIDRCIECGLCSSVCPSRIKLSQAFELYHSKIRRS